MINHIRTLLLNCTPTSDDVVGEEYVSPKFVPRVYTPAIARAQIGLFGSKPSREEVNYRLRQFMTMLHSTELEAYVLEPDSRITYWPFEDSIELLDVPDLPTTALNLEEALSYDDEKSIFGDPLEEPYATFHRLWQTSDNFAHKLGSLLLAVAYRTDELGTV